MKVLKTGVLHNEISWMGYFGIITHTLKTQKPEHESNALNSTATTRQPETIVRNQLFHPI